MIIDMHKSQFSVVLGLVIATSGCGAGSALATVKGAVSLDDKPVARATVMLRPKLGGRPAWANTSDDGSFILTTYKNGDGALIGLHSVTVSKIEEAPIQEKPSLESPVATLAVSRQNQNQKRWVVPERYSRVATSGIEFEVKRGPNTLVLDLEENQ